MDIVEIESKASKELHKILLSLRKEFVNLAFQKNWASATIFRVLA